MNYIENRLKPQIEYYDKTATKYKKLYIRISTFIIILNAAIPVLACLLETPNIIIKLIIAIVGAMSTVFSSYLLLIKAKDNWISYRLTCEYLESQLAIYESQEQKDLQKLIDNCECIMTEEHKIWNTRHQSTAS